MLEEDGAANKTKKGGNANAASCRTLTWTFDKGRLACVRVARHRHTTLRAVDKFNVVGDVDPKEAAVLQKKKKKKKKRQNVKRKKRAAPCPSIQT
jgi:hypothetical protein